MNRAEETFYLHLKDSESLRVIFAEGLDIEVLPTEGLRPAWEFARRYFTDSGFSLAPSAEAFETEMADLLKDFDLDIHQDPEDTVQWAVMSLKNQAVYLKVAVFQKQFASDMASAPDSYERLEVLSAGATELLRLSQAAQSYADRVEMREAAPRVFNDYLVRTANGSIFEGMTLGLDAVDNHTYHIRPGELAIMAAGPKVGKSFALAHAALHNWRAGRATMLFTLENSVTMTIERIACMASGVDSGAWQRGELTTRDMERVMTFLDELHASEHGDVPFWIISPDIGQRGFEAMVAEAQIRGVEALFIDQLTFVELSGTSRQAKHERIGNSLHELKAMISTGRSQIPCALAHQINREGVKAAQARGFLEMYHLAEASEVERTADWVFGLYASRDDRVVHQIRLQILASRRETNRNWQLNWQPATGNISVLREILSLE